MIKVLLADDLVLIRKSIKLLIDGSDNIKIVGKETLTYGEVNSHNDHRIAMMLAIASTKCIKDVKILNSDCVKISFPQFFEVFEKYGRNS